MTARCSRVRRCRRAAGTLAVGFVLLVVGAHPASAHTNLLGTSPGDGWVLPHAPRTVTLTFSERVSLDLVEVTVERASGDIVVTTAPRRGERATELVVTLPAGLERDAYRVRYKVRDPIDLHLTTGSIVFGVGHAAMASGGDNDVPIRPLESVLRWLEWGGLALAVGALTVVLRKARAISDDAARRAVLERALRLVPVGVVAAALANGIAAAMEIADIGGPLGPTARQVLLSSVYGRRFLVTLQLAVAVVVVLRMDRPFLLPGRSSPSTARQRGPVILLGALVASAAFAGHAGTGGAFAAGVALRAAHLAGIGLWVGGLTAVVLVAPLAGAAGRRELLASFSRTAALGVVTTIASGLVLAGREVTSLTALASTLFGWVLTVKVVLVLVVLGLGAWHARRIQGGRPVGRSTLRAEAVLGVLVLGAGALLASSQPAVGARFAPPHVPSPTTHTVAADDLLVRLSLGPNHPGPNTPEVVVLETRRPSLGAVTSVTVALTTASGEVLVRRGVPAPDGRVALDPVDLAAPGAVTAEVAVDRPKAPVPTARMTVTVDPFPAARAATVVSDQPIGPFADRVAAGLVAVAAAMWVAGRRRRRMLAAAVVLASIVAGCSGGSDPASSAFCKKQAEVVQLGSATENVDDTDAAGLRAAWGAYVHKADEAVADAPATLRADYRTYTAWLDSLHGALERHNYNFGGALSDKRFLEATNDERVGTARGNVDGYALGTCKVHISASTPAGRS